MCKKILKRKANTAMTFLGMSYYSCSLSPIKDWDLCNNAVKVGDFPELCEFYSNEERLDFPELNPSFNRYICF